MADFRYKLEKGSKKHLCPSCGKKRFVRFVDLQTGEYTPEVYGACDRADKCGYSLSPYKDGYAKMVWKRENGETTDWRPDRVIYSPPKPKPLSFVPTDVLHSTLSDYEHNTFIQNLLSNVAYPFNQKDVEVVISQYYLGTISSGYRKGAVTFPFIDDKGKVRAIQVKNFDSDNHTTTTDFIHSILKKECKPVPEWISSYEQNETKVSCLFGTHLLSKYPRNPIALVEAPKSAVYGALYFGSPATHSDMLWLAVYNLSSLTLSRCQVLSGRDVYLFPDLSLSGHAYDQWSKKAIQLEQQLPGTKFIVSDLLQRLGTDKQKDAGCDIADILIQQDWRDYRKSDESDESDPPNKSFFKSKNTDKTAASYNGNKNVVSKPSLLSLSSQSKIENQEYLKAKTTIASMLAKASGNPPSDLDNSVSTMIPSTEIDLSEEIEELREFFKTKSIPKGAIQLCLGTTIRDIPHMVKTHFAFVEARPCSKSSLPYLNRLKSLKKIITASNNKLIGPN